MGQATKKRQATARRPQQRAIETRERLVDAALEVFAKHGFDGATTREIASQAGVALAALPYHFTTKEAIWKAAADRIFGQFAEHFRSHGREMEGADPRSRLRVVLRKLVLFAAKHPELHRFMLQEGTDRGDRLVWLVDTHVRPLYRTTVGLIQEAQKHGVLVEGRGEQIFYALIGAASLPYAVAPEYELLTRAKPDSKQRVEDHVHFLLRLFQIDT
jgi:AcrR family transcriptional regulator